MSIIEQLLEKAKARTDAAEVFYTQSEATAAAWASDRLKIAEGKESSGVALRVMVDGKMGFFATTKMDDPDMIVDTAIELAPLGTEFAGEFPDSYDPADVDAYDEPTAQAGPDKIVETGNKMVADAKSGKSDAMYDGKLDRTIIRAEIANSKGAHSEFRKTIFEGYLSGSVTREGDVLIIWDFDASTKMGDQPSDWVKWNVETLNAASNVVSLPSGDYKCILTPKALDMFGPLQMALNARNVLKDMSPFGDKVGEQVFDPRINLVDDGLNALTPSAQPIDDEGVTMQKTTLIENGVLKGFIHDLHTSAKMGVASTGNGMRGGLSATPRAGFTTLTLMPGDKSLDELVASVDKGVLIDQIMGAHQASPFSGDFSVSVSLGFVIENGKIVGRFKDGMMAGNVFRMMKDKVIETGSEQRLAHMYAPPVLFDGITIAT